LKVDKKEAVLKENPKRDSKPVSAATAPVSPETEVKFYALTYASHGGSDDFFCRSLRSALKQNVKIRLLGWNSNNVQLVRKVRFIASLPSCVVSHLYVHIGAECTR